MLVLLLSSCTGEIAGPSATTDDTAVVSFGITLLDPSSGPSAGDTLVRVTGAGFTSATTATIGDSACTSLTFLSSSELLCLTPAGPEGESEFRVQDGTQTDGEPFLYLADLEDTGPIDTGEPAPTVASCTLLLDVLTVEEDTSTSEIGALVVVPARTEGEGQGVGVELELGYGLAGRDPSEWEWSAAYYASDSGDGDVYDDTLYITNEGLYEFAMRARVDHGEWTDCFDSTGTPGTLTVTHSTDPVPVDYCHLQWPCSTSVSAGDASEDIYAWIYHGGESDAAGQAPGLSMDLGVGPAGTDPATDASWVWTTMGYFSDKDGLYEGDLANDEYVGNFIAPATAGSYDYTARASADRGISYTLCDLGGDSCNYGGSSDGYDDPGSCSVN